MKTLAFESSAQPGELALLDGDVVLQQRSLPSDRKTTETFASSIQQILRQSDVRPVDIQLMAISEGPGSFTGLRIGITTAKTFAYATKCHVVAVNTLELLAAQSRQCEPVWAVLDAQRQQWFVAQFEPRDALWRASTPIQIVGPADWLNQLPVGSMLTGSGLHKWRTALPDHVRVTPEACWTPQARQLALTAQAQLRDRGPADIWKLTPRYYRKSAAEEKLGPDGKGRTDGTAGTK